MSELHRHMAQSAQTDHPNFLAFAYAPVTHRRICCDAGAEKWRSSGQLEVRRDAQNEMFVDHNAFGVATISDLSGLVVIRRVEGERHVRTELLEPGFALWA